MPFKWSRRELVAGALASGAVVPLAGAAHAQAWPSKPIKIVVGYPAGGLTDLFARAYGDYISQKVGQPVLVENKAGAGGIIGAQTVKSAPPDGYTLMFTISSTMIMNRVLYKSLPYDPDKDFVLISHMSAGELPFVVHKSTGAKTVKDFFEHAKTNKLTHGTYAAGSYAHIVMAELNKHFGTNVEIVHYRGESPMWADLNAGVIQSAVGSYQAASNVLQSGVGVALAVPRKSRALPDVPTFTELGIKSKAFDVSGFVCLVGPAGMPKDAVEKLSTLMVEAGKSERVQKLLETYGINDAAKGQAEFQKIYEFEKPIWIELVTQLNLTPQ